MLKAFKYRLYPDKESSIFLNKHFGCARWLYKYLIQSQIRLKRLQRRLSRKQKGSSNRDKARLLLAAQHEKVFNQRNDFLQKTTFENLFGKDTDPIGATIRFNKIPFTVIGVLGEKYHGTESG